MRILLEPAFVLHHRPYRETSLLLDIFTEHHGRISLVAKNVRTPSSRLKSLLQSFSPLLISFQGRSELKLLISAEPNGLPFLLKGHNLYSGFYLNELLMRMLQKEDPSANLYTIYQKTLLELTNTCVQEKPLRIFEKNLLIELGYGLLLNQELASGNSIQEEAYYIFYPENGFKLQEDQTLLGGFKGSSLLALVKEQWNNEESLQDAKRLMRLVLKSLLGDKPLHSRALFKR